MFVSDGDPYPKLRDLGFIAIGYISGPHIVGKTPSGFLQKLALIEVVVIRWGSKKKTTCEYCGEVFMNAQFISTDRNNRFVWPELLRHHIARHNYRPPQTFINWVMAF